MNITDFQKKIIAKILDSKVYDILSFMVEYFDMPKINSRADFESVIYNIRTKGINENIRVNELSSSCKKVVEFFVICKYLEKKNLIFVKPSEHFILFHFVSDFIDSKSKDEVGELNNLLYKYPREEYYASPELKSFVENGYKTNEELLNLKLLEEAKGKSNILFYVSIILILISFAVLIITKYS